MLKQKIYRYKKHHLLSKLKSACDYRFLFARSHFDNNIKIFNITSNEFRQALNINDTAMEPSWLTRLNRNNILSFTNMLGMELTKYQINLVQTTYFPWGRKETFVEDEWMFENSNGITLYTSSWLLSGETSFILRHNLICNNSVFFNIQHKSRLKQLKRSLLAIKMICNTIYVESLADVIDKFRNEQIIIELIVDSAIYENKNLIYAEYNASFDNQQYFFKFDLKGKYYLLGASSDYYDYLSFDVNHISNYSFKDIYELLRNK